MSRFRPPPREEIRRDLRLNVWGTRITLLLFLLIYVPINHYLFGLSWGQVAAIEFSILVIGFAIAETGFRRALPIHKRGRYPSSLAVELSVLREFPQACEASLRLTGQWLGAKTGLLAWLKDSRLVVLASYGLSPQALQLIQMPSPEETTLRATLQERRAVVNRPSTSPFWRGLVPDDYIAALMPLMSLDRVVGIIALAGPRTATDLRDRRLLEAMGLMIGLSLDNMHLHQHEYETTLQVLSCALDVRDQATEGHSQRVAYLAGLLARQLGLPEEEVKKIEQAAILHDIGKIGIADAILSKAGPLNEDEWAEMRRHPQLGFEILCGIESMREAAEVVYCHHERYDGRGYPRGLRGEEIPLGARIFAVVDAYDAMTSHRPYRPPRSHDEAIREIIRCSGSQFDPTVVQAFLELERQGLIRPQHLPPRRRAPDLVAAAPDNRPLQIGAPAEQPTQNQRRDSAGGKRSRSDRVPFGSRARP